MGQHRCIGPALTIVAAMAHGRPIFQSPPDRRQEADVAKRALTAGSAAARSDHIAIVAAFETWNAARLKDGRQAAFTVQLLSIGIDSSPLFLTQADSSPAAGCQRKLHLGRSHGGHAAGARRLCPHHGRHGLPPARLLGLLQHSGSGPDDSRTGADEYSGNARVIKAAICAGAGPVSDAMRMQPLHSPVPDCLDGWTGFYPNILRVDHPPAVFKEVLGGAMETDSAPARLRFFDRTKGMMFPPCCPVFQQLNLCTSPEEKHACIQAACSSIRHPLSSAAGPTRPAGACTPT